MPPLPSRTRPPASDPVRRSAARPTVRVVGVDPALPSFRLRLAPLVDHLAELGVDAGVVALRGPEWLRVMRLARVWAASDVLVFAKVKLLPGELALVRRGCRTWVLDIDDAVMYRKPRRHGDPPDAARWRRRRFARMVGGCRLVVAASRSLASTIAGARVEVVPTPVALADYPPAALVGEPPLKLAWIGVGANLRYLRDLAPPLRRLAGDGLRFELRVISDRLPDLPGVPCRLVRWSEREEGPALAACDVGLAPLPDDAWTRGKGAYRCIQYAAAGLPAVAAPVGANREVVEPGQTGLWATTAEEWRAAILRLAEDPLLRRRLGAAARERAGRYDRGVLLPRYADLVLRLLEPAPSPGTPGR